MKKNLLNTVEQMEFLVSNYKKVLSPSFEDSYDIAKEILYFVSYWFEEWEAFMGFESLFPEHKDSELADQITHWALCLFPSDSEAASHIRYAKNKCLEDQNKKVEIFIPPADNPYGVDVLDD